MSELRCKRCFVADDRVLDLQPYPKHRTPTDCLAAVRHEKNEVALHAADRADRMEKLIASLLVQLEKSGVVNVYLHRSRSALKECALAAIIRLAYKQTGRELPLSVRET